MQEPIKEPPRLKKRFQIHIYTILVLLYVVAVLIVMNIHPHSGPVAFLFHDDRYPISDENGWFEKVYGWPIRIDDFVRFRYWPFGLDINIGIFVNLGVALIIVFIVYFLCEWLIRRRARERTRNP